MNTLMARALQPVPATSLALIRVLLGILILATLAGDWSRIGAHLVRPAFHFTYDGFTWVEPLGGRGMFWVSGVLMGAAALFSVGLLYRAAAAVLATGLAWLFLIDQARYSSNAYFVILFVTLMAMLPANRAWSLDRKLFGSAAGSFVPAGALWAVALLAAVPLVYGGLHRLAPDWTSGYPLQLWFKTAAAGHGLGPDVGGFLAKKAVAVGWSWFVLAVHLAIVPLLLWRRTRLVALALFIAVYAGYSVAFGRVIFPFAIFLATLAFLPPDWPSRLLALLRRKPAPDAVAAPPAPPSRAGQAAIAGVLALLAFHVLFPARSLAYPGPAAWSGDGYRFSWRDLLDDRYCEVAFRVVDPATGRGWNAALPVRFAAFQVPELQRRPDMMLQAAYEIERQYQLEFGLEDPQVFLRGKCSLNTRPFGPLADHTLDLTTVGRSWGATAWITPFDPRMPPGWRGIVQRP